MSNEESCSDYNDDSFDNESIEEVSENESVCSSLSTEGIVPEVPENKSSNGSLDRLSLEEEGENELSSSNLDEPDNAILQLLTEADESQPNVNEHEHEIDESDSENEIESSFSGSPNRLSLEEEGENDLSSLNLDEPDNAISQLLQEADQSQPKKNGNEHEIDESDSENEIESVIVESVMSLNVEDKKENKTDADSIPLIIETTVSDDENSFEGHNIKGAGEKYNNSDSCVTVVDQPQIEFDIRSETPTSFNSDDHAFHVDILKEQERYISNKRQIEKKSRNSNRKSLSFSNERMREIERHNQILLRKILTQKPRKETHSTVSPRVSSSAVNRKKQQRQIDMDNQVLKRKLEAIACRRKSVFQ